LACTFYFYINSKLQQVTIIFYNKQESLAFQKIKNKGLYSQLELQTPREGNQAKVLHDQLFAQIRQDFLQIQAAPSDQQPNKKLRHKNDIYRLV